MGRSAGLWTFPLVAIASCGFLQATEGILHGSPVGNARAVEGLITLVGFIGSGAIVKSGTSVHGTDTAASLWATGAIGSAVSLGAYDVTSGQSRHRQPYFRTWHMPLITHRLLAGFTPRRCIGTRGSSLAHLSSLSQNSFAISTLLQLRSVNQTSSSRTKWQLSSEPKATIDRAGSSIKSAGNGKHEIVPGNRNPQISRPPRRRCPDMPRAPPDRHERWLDHQPRSAPPGP
jgi:hypothetical protein